MSLPLNSIPGLARLLLAKVEKRGDDIKKKIEELMIQTKDKLGGKTQKTKPVQGNKLNRK